MSKTLLLIRGFNAERDVGLVQKLDKNCEVGSKKKISIYFDNMGDPLCRIRCYPVHIMLVAEMPVHGELVGVIQGCIKEVGAGLGRQHVKMGCILGLRVSPKDRRMGIGLELMKAMEEWLGRNSAKYIHLATEEDNIASKNLFTLKCNYRVLSSLLIFAQHMDTPIKKTDPTIHIKKLQLSQAVSLYRDKLKSKDLYPADIEEILKAKPNLGTWVCYSSDEGWEGLHNEDQNDNTIMSTTRLSSWIIFSIWNSSEIYKLQVRRSSHFYYVLSALSLVKEVIFPCVKLPVIHGSCQNSFGFLLIYGLDGEGDNKELRDLTAAAWNFAAKLAESMKDCKLIMAEVGTLDPFKELIPQDSSTLCIKDLWYLKAVDDSSCHKDELMMKSSKPLGNVFIDPRDF